MHLLHCQALPLPEHRCAPIKSRAVPHHTLPPPVLPTESLCVNQCMPSCANQLCQTRGTDLAHVSLRKGNEPVKKLEGAMGQAALSQLLHEGSQPSTVKLGHALCSNLQGKSLPFLGWGLAQEALSVGMMVCRAGVLPNIAHIKTEDMHSALACSDVPPGDGMGALSWPQHQIHPII